MSRPIAYVTLTIRIVPVGFGIVFLVSGALYFREGNLVGTFWCTVMAALGFLFRLLQLPSGSAAISTDGTSVTFVSLARPWPSISIQRDQIDRFSFCRDLEQQEDVIIHIKAEHKASMTEALRKCKSWLPDARGKWWRSSVGVDPDALVYRTCCNLYCCSNLKIDSEAIANDLNEWLHETELATPNGTYPDKQ